MRIYQVHGSWRIAPDRPASNEPREARDVFVVNITDEGITPVGGNLTAEGARELAALLLAAADFVDGGGRIEGHWRI